MQEIGRRSGAPGELVVRRDLGQGRREEIYITRAELEQKILVLPPDLRSAFDPLGLIAQPPRPASSAPPPRLGTSMPPRLPASVEAPLATLEASE